LPLISPWPLLLDIFCVFLSKVAVISSLVLGKRDINKERTVDRLRKTLLEQKGDD